MITNHGRLHAEHRPPGKQRENEQRARHPGHDIRVADRALNERFAGTYMAYLAISPTDDVTAEELQAFVDDVAAERVPLGLDRTFTLDEIVEAHRYMEANRARGKLVVTT